MAWFDLIWYELRKNWPDLIWAPTKIGLIWFDLSSEKNWLDLIWFEPPGDLIWFEFLAEIKSNQNYTKNPKIQTWFEDIFEYFFASKYAGSMQLAELGQSRTLFILVDGGYTYL